MIDTKKVTAVILAGETSQEIYPDSTVRSRAMIPLAGKPVIQWIIQALKESQVIDRIVVVGNIRADGADTLVPPIKDGSFLDSIMAGLDAVSDAERVLVCTSDIPLVTGDGIADFVDKALSADAWLALPIIEKSLCELKYPELKRTYVSLREGTFTLGNIALLDAAFMRNNNEMVRRTFAARKSPLKLAAMIGFGTIFRFAFSSIGVHGALPLSNLEESVSRLLGGPVKAVLSKYPEIGEDMDRPGDLQIFESIFAQTRR